MLVLSVFVPDAQRQHAHDSEPDDGVAHYEVTELQRVCTHLNIHTNMCIHTNMYIHTCAYTCMHIRGNWVTKRDIM